LTKPFVKFAEVYDSIMPDKFYTDYYGFIVEVLKRSALQPKSVLELACGTGKLARILLDKGFNIEGLDSSEHMLEVAKKKGLKVHHANMVNFEMRRKFDLTLCVFDSLNYIQEQSELLRCFNSVRSHLDTEGLFIFDMNSSYKINKIIPRNPVKAQYFKVGDIELVWLNSHQQDTWIAELIFFERTRDGKYRRFYEKHVEKAYKLGNVRKLLRRAGFSLAGSCSDFEFSEIGRKSGRWFFMCTLS